MFSQTEKIVYVCKNIPNRMKSALSAGWTFVRKYLSLKVVVAVIFIVIMIFVDENSFMQRAAYNRQIRKLKGDVEKYQQEINESRYKLNELQSNDENLEKFAREEYLMRKPNEDIYLINEEQTDL